MLHVFALILAVLLQISTFDETLRRLTRVHHANKQIKRGKEAFLKNDFKTAAEAHRLAVEQYGVKNEQALLNLAHAYYRLADNPKAQAYYQKLLQSTNKELASVAAQQLGNLAYQAGDKQSALEWYKQALRANPKNRDARYNYELVKRKKEQEDQQKQNNKNQSSGSQNDKQEQESPSNPANNKNTENNKKQGGQNQKNGQSPTTAEKNGQNEADEMENSDNGNQQAPDLSKPQADENALMKAGKEELRKMGLSEEKAKMLLEAMRNSEIQFLQQNQLKQQNKNKSNKPAW